MNQPALFYDDVNGSLRAVVAALGGAKKVGAQFWPEKELTTAARYLNNCLDPDRNEKLSLEQIMLLLAWGKDVGCHVAMYFIAAESGYAEPATREPQDEMAELQRAFIQSVKDQATLFTRIEKLSAGNVTNISKRS